MTATSQPAGQQDNRKIIDCPRCNKGRVVIQHSSGIWWKEQHLRCAFCRGTGRVYASRA